MSSIKFLDTRFASLTRPNPVVTQIGLRGKRAGTKRETYAAAMNVKLMIGEYGNGVNLLSRRQVISDACPVCLILTGQEECDDEPHHLIDCVALGSTMRVQMVAAVEEIVKKVLRDNEHKASIVYNSTAQCATYPALCRRTLPRRQLSHAPSA